MIRLVRLVPLALVPVLAAGACRKKAPEVAPTPTPTVNRDSIAAAERARAREDSIARAEAARRDAITRADNARRDSLERIRMESEGLVSALRTTMMAAIYFDYDSDALSGDARTALDAKLPILTANPSLRIRVAGHADDRGADEYNLALSQRRASAAKRYLTQRGIAEDRIEVVSFGEERPLCTDQDESCWSRNRRDEFEITAGGDRMAAPSSR